MQNRSTLTIVLAFLEMLTAAPTFANNNNTYACNFTKECPTGQPCFGYDAPEMRLSQDNDSGNWSLKVAEADAIAFTELRLNSQSLRTFVSTTFDRDASAVSLLSIFSDGQSILSTHGVFFSPGSVTHLGTCVPKDN